MAAKNGRGRASAQERERARVYQARQTYVADQRRRRARDNVLAGVVGGIVIIGAIAAQTAFFALQPADPAPTPSSTVSTPPDPAATSDPAASPDPAATPEPAPTTTPTTAP